MFPKCLVIGNSELVKEQLDPPEEDPSLVQFDRTIPANSMTFAKLSDFFCISIHFALSFCISIHFALSFLLRY
jgi:hypothetical protein